MTSSQEPPLTRREARERERLAQHGDAATADGNEPDAPTPAPPAQSSPAPQFPLHPPAPAFPQAPNPPQPSAARVAASPAPTPPQVAGAPFAPQRASAPPSAPSPFGGPIVAPGPDGEPAASAPPVARPAPMPPAAPTVAPASGPGGAPGWAPREAPSADRAAEASGRPGRTPERTLTRRELRALIDAQQADLHDDDSDLFETSNDGASDGAPAANTAGPTAARPPADPVARTALPHQASSATRAEEPTVVPKPAGHWTDQLHLPDEQAAPFDQVLSRGTGSHGVPTTTNALILPSLPDQGGIAPMAEGSEIIVTGSVDLPRSYAATGVHPSQVDSSDIDHLFDSDDAATAGVKPVAATSAISTQAGPRTVVTPPKKDGMNVPLVLALTAGVLALGVVTTLIVGAVSGLFG